MATLQEMAKTFNTYITENQTMEINNSKILPKGTKIEIRNIDGRKSTDPLKINKLILDQYGYQKFKTALRLAVKDGTFNAFKSEEGDYKPISYGSSFKANQTKLGNLEFQNKDEAIKSLEIALDTTGTVQSNRNRVNVPATILRRLSMSDDDLKKTLKTILKNSK